MAKKATHAKTQAPPSAAPKAGYIADFISGQQVKDSPEERDAVQVFSRRLVEDFGYPKEHIQTRPQYRVRCRPSDEDKSYPVDIAVFRDPMKIEDGLQMIVECKQKTRKDGIHQLKIYLDMSPAEIGIWFNGDEHEYLRKVHHQNGKRTYEPLPTIPRFGQRIEDIGLYKRQDLRKPSNLKAVFRDLRNHLAGMTTGITRDEALAQEIINLLFCKILDEQETEPDQMVTFRAGVDEKPEAVRQRILKIFERVKSATYEDVFVESDTINLDADSLRYVVGELQGYCVMDADRDAIGDAFEVFIGPALRGAEGQFFTPRNVVKMLVELVDPKPGEKIIDPACGSGGFLIAALEHVWGQLREEAKRKNWNQRQLFKREVEVATDCFRGIDKDAFLAKVCKAYMALIGDGRGGVFCANSLSVVSDWPHGLQEKAKLGTFDVVLTNPPFGARIPVKGQALLSQYSLARRWEENEDGPMTETNHLKESESPQILFVERCVQLLRPGGRLGIVLPEGILGNKGMGYVLDYLRKEGRVVGIVDCTRRLFQPHTDTKTNVVIWEKHDHKKGAPSDPDVWMSVVKTCGHDKRGKPTFLENGAPADEVIEVASSLASERPRLSRLAFRKPLSSLLPYYLVPRYYSPEVEETVQKFVAETSATLVSIGDLVTAKKLQISKGHEIGSDAYGTGDVPFIRTSDIANLEITYDPTFAVNEDFYQTYGPKQGLKTNDILFVNDGRYRIGNVCLLTEHDTRIIIQSHFRVIRSTDPKFLDPFLLLYLFRHPVVRLQVEAKTFIQSTIATLGARLKELLIPVPKDTTAIQSTIDTLRRNITERARLRVELQRLDEERDF